MQSLFIPLMSSDFTKLLAPGPAAELFPSASQPMYQSIAWTETTRERADLPIWPSVVKLVRLGSLFAY